MAFKDIVPDISAIDTHSLRSGRATSESAKDGYVQDYLSARLSVSKALRI